MLLDQFLETVVVTVSIAETAAALAPFLALLHRLPRFSRGRFGAYGGQDEREQPHEQPEAAFGELLHRKAPPISDSLGMVRQAVRPGIRTPFDRPRGPNEP